MIGRPTHPWVTHSYVARRVSHCAYRGILEFVLRKPLGRLAIAVLASVAIPLSFIPTASAADQYNAPSVSVSAFVDNSATGVDIGGGFGMLRINSSAGEPLDITSADFEVVGTVSQAEEDSRAWEAKVRFKGQKSFAKSKPSVTFHCGGGGGYPPPTKPTKPTSSTPTTTKTTPSTSVTPTSDTPTTSETPTSDTPTTSETPTSDTPTSTPTSETTTSTPVDTTSDTPTSSAAPTTTSKPGGGTVTCPVKPVGTTPTGPQQVVRPVAAPETGFGGTA